MIRDGQLDGVRTGFRKFESGLLRGGVAGCKTPDAVADLAGRTVVGDRPVISGCNTIRCVGRIGSLYQERIAAEIVIYSKSSGRQRQYANRHLAAVFAAVIIAEMVGYLMCTGRSIQLKIEQAGGIDKRRPRPKTDPACSRGTIQLPAFVDAYGLRAAGAHHRQGQYHDGDGIPIDAIQAACTLYLIQIRPDGSRLNRNSGSSRHKCRRRWKRPPHIGGSAGSGKCRRLPQTNTVHRRLGDNWRAIQDAHVYTSFLRTSKGIGYNQTVLSGIFGACRGNHRIAIGGGKAVRPSPFATQSCRIRVGKNQRISRARGVRADLGDGWEWENLESVCYKCAATGATY